MKMGYISFIASGIFLVVGILHLVMNPTPADIVFGVVFVAISPIWLIKGRNKIKRAKHERKRA